MSDSGKAAATGSTAIGRSDVQRLYQDLGAALVLYAAAILGERPAAEDAVHQVFFKLLAEPVEVPEDARPYLFRAVRNAALNRRRGEARERARRPTAEALFDAPSELGEARVELEAALAALPGEQREVVVMRVWGGMTFQQAAELLGISQNTAASRYRYALIRLRERLARFAE